MSVFNQDIEKSVYQDMVSKNSDLYKNCLADEFSNAHAQYDGRTLDIVSQMSTCAIPLDEEDDLFQKYLPCIEHINFKSSYPRIYQSCLDGHDMVIDSEGFFFMGQNLSNITINSISSTPGVTIFANLLENVSINSKKLRFLESTNPSGWSAAIPQGKNVSVSKNCKVVIRVCQYENFYKNFKPLIDLKHMNAAECSTFEKLIAFLTDKFYHDIEQVFPVNPGCNIQKFLGLPNYLTGLDEYEIFLTSIVSNTIQTIRFSKTLPPKKKYVHLLPPTEDINNAIYQSEDGYYIMR